MQDILPNAARSRRIEQSQPDIVQRFRESEGDDALPKRIDREENDGKPHEGDPQRHHPRAPLS